MSRHRLLTTILGGTIALAASSAPARGQAVYVSASLTADIVRFDRTESRGQTDLSPNGEALGFALRAGVPLGSIWGVELEFARASAIEFEAPPLVVPLLDFSFIPTRSIPGDLSPPGLSNPAIYPPISFRLNGSYRDTTLSAALWVEQVFSSRMSLVYSGGVAFHRAERTLTYSFEPVPASISPGLPAFLPSPISAEVVSYGARPFAGIEARIGMTDHVELIPGIRLHGLEGGLMIRPSIGLGWRF